MIPFISIPSALLLAWINDKYQSSKRLLFLLVPLSAIALVIGSGVRNDIVLVLALVLYCCTGKMAIDPLLLYTVKSNASSEQLSMTYGVYNFCGSIASILAPVVTGFLIDITRTMTAGFYTAAGILLFGVICFGWSQKNLISEKMMLKGDINSLLAYFGQFGFKKNHGYTRQVYDKQWLSAQQAYIKLAKEFGLYPFIDEMGSVYVSSIPDIGVEDDNILTGSHMDTVVDGGLYDGLYGALASLLAVKQLVNQYGTANVPLIAVAFSEEEGSRFPTAFTGSRYLIDYKQSMFEDLVD